MYVRKSFAVDAVPASDGPDAVRAMVGSLTVRTSTGLVFVHDGIEVEVPASAWVVKESGDILVVSAEAFAERYEAVADAAPVSVPVEPDPEPSATPEPTTTTTPEPVPAPIIDPAPKGTVSVTTPASTKGKPGKK